MDEIQQYMAQREWVLVAPKGGYHSLTSGEPRAQGELRIVKYGVSMEVHWALHPFSASVVACSFVPKLHAE